MLRVQLVPCEVGSHFIEPRLDQVAAFEWNVRVLASPDVQ
jgi:hypothetical protein